MIVADTPGFAKDARLRFVLHAAPGWAALRDMLALGQVDAAPMPARCRSPPFGVDTRAGGVGASGHLILPRDQFLDARIFDPKATAGPKMRRMNAADAKNPARRLTLRCGIDSLNAVRRAMTPGCAAREAGKRRATPLDLKPPSGGVFCGFTPFNAPSRGPSGKLT